MLSLANYTLSKLTEQAITPKLKFIFNSVDESGSVVSFPAISRSADTITAGSAAIEVFNGNKYWNRIKTFQSANMRQLGKIQMEIMSYDNEYLNMWNAKTWGSKKWYKGENLDIFTGRLEDIQFREDKAVLTFKDKMGYIFDRKIGSEDNPVDFYTAAGWNTINFSAGVNPADMVWYLFTGADLGNLDDTASTANTDINYAQWVLWKAMLTAQGMVLKGNFTGQTIGEILVTIGKLTHSTIFAEGDGLIYCRYYYNEVDSGGSGDFNRDNIFSSPNMTLNVTDIKNRVAVYYGYNPVVNLPANGNMERTTHSDLQCDYWQESGVTNVRSATQKKYGGYSLKITPTAITDYSYQDLVNYSEYKGLSISVSVWVYAPDASAVIRISDGVSYTDSAANTTTGAWELLTVTRVIDASATRVRIELRPTNTTGDFYFDAAVMVLGTGAPITEAWTDYVDKTDDAGLENAASQAIYGIREMVYSDTSVWIVDSVNAIAFGTRIVTWWKDPKYEIEFDTGLMGFSHQLSDAIRVTYPLFDVYASTTEGFALKEITMNPMSGLCSWKCRQMNFQDYFILDDAALGLLDQVTNPLF